MHKVVKARNHFIPRIQKLSIATNHFYEEDASKQIIHNPFQKPKRNLEDNDKILETNQTHTVLCNKRRNSD